MRHRFFLAFLVVCCLSLPVFCAAPTDVYRLGPGDLIVVTVVDNPTFGGNATVLADGTVQLPVVNQVAVAGLTLAEATKVLTESYRKRLLKPEVYITLIAPQLTRAYIVGAVAKPGVYFLAKNLTSVLDMLVAAGGLTRTADTCVASLIHKTGGEKISVRLTDLLAGDQKADIQLLDGDLLTIDARPTISVFVAGEVETPGLYELPPGATTSQALAAAHGIKGDINGMQASILRGKTTLPLNLVNLYLKKPDDDPPLQPGDVVQVESMMVPIDVSGDVRLPAIYPAARGLDLQDVIALAGGMNDTALRSAVAVTHADGRKQVIDLTVPLPARQRLEITDGDKIFVPSTFVLVNVTGEVKIPGNYLLSSQVSLLEAITIAGGFSTNASQSTVKLYHVNGTAEVFDLAAGRPVPVGWHTGDRILVSPMTARITIVGNVMSPGFLPFDPFHPYKASEAVIRAGGAKPKTALKKAQILRLDKDGNPQRIAVNLDAVLLKLDTKKDVQLQPGDLVYVPAASSTFSLAELTSLLITYHLIETTF